MRHDMLVETGGNIFYTKGKEMHLKHPLVE